jgi:hypothetical protein
MEAKVLNINEFRRRLSERVEAAHWTKEATVIEFGARKEPRAALVPVEVGDNAVAIDAKGDVRSYVVSREWYERAKQALGEN